MFQEISFRLPTHSDPSNPDPSVPDLRVYEDAVYPLELHISPIYTESFHQGSNFLHPFYLIIFANTPTREHLFPNCPDQEGT